MTKPFSTDELLARLRAATRRLEEPPARARPNAGAAAGAVVTTDEFTVDLRGRVTAPRPTA